MEHDQSAVEAQLRELNPVEVQRLACRATGRAIVDPGEWRWRQIYGGGTPPTIGVYRVAGVGRDRSSPVHWSVVFKAVRCPPAGLGGPSEGDPTARAYWKREILAYQSRLLADLPGGLSAPRCLEVSERPGGMVWLWLEDLHDPNEAAWPLARYALAARHLGAFNGAYLTQRPFPGYPWLRTRVPASALPAADAQPDIRLILDNQTWRDPRLGDVFPAAMVDRLREQWEDRAALLDAFLSLPHTLCHWDAHRLNLFAGHNPAGEAITVAVDWASVGAGPVGAELGNLVLGSIIVEAVPASEGTALDGVVFPAYLDGLRAAGWRGDARLARFAFTAMAALATAPTLHGFLVRVLERGGLGGPEDTSPAPTALQLARWSGLTTFSLDLGDEALDLLPTI